MGGRHSLGRLAGAVALVAGIIGPARAADRLPAGWLETEIGATGAAGSASVNPQGNWTIMGSGSDIEGTSDQFHFVYQKISGDCTITAHFLGMAPGNYPWTKMGPMIRAITSEDAGNGDAQNATLDITSGIGVRLQGRDDAFANTQDNIAPALGLSQPEPMWLRLERMGKQVAGFYSLDGKIWYWGGGTLTLSTLQQDALVGLAITSHWYGTLATGTFDSVSIQPGASVVSGLQSCPTDKGVMLTWQPLPGADGYNVYRAPIGETDLTHYVKLNGVTAVSDTSFTDATPGLLNDRQYVYVVTPLMEGTSSQEVEGDRSAIQAGPYRPAAPPGFANTNINEDPNQQIDYMGGCIPPLGAFYDSDSDTTVVRGAGRNGLDGLSGSDTFDFTSKEVTGDFQVSVKALSLPVRTDELAKAGLMIREGLTPGARSADLVLTPSENGLIFEWRASPNGYDPYWSNTLISPENLIPPLWIRLTRKGDQIVAEYSLDGSTWQGSAEPGNQATIAGLAATVNVGLAITSNSAPDSSLAITQETFQNLTIGQ